MFEGIDFSRTNGWCECSICHLCYFLKYIFRFQLIVSDGCHDLMEMVKSFNNVTFASVKENHYRSHFWYTSKDEAVNLLTIADLTEESGKL